MATIVGTYEIPVPARAEWTIGPVFRKGERVHVRASGVVAWRAAKEAVLQRDTFANAGNDPYLLDHDGEMNCDWQDIGGTTNTLVLENGAVHSLPYDVYGGGDHGHGDLYTGGYVPPTPDCRVSATFQNRGVPSGATCAARILGRCDLAKGRYALAHSVAIDGAARWAIERHDPGGGIATLAIAAGAIPVGGSARGLLSMQGSAIRGYVDGVLVLEASDAAIPGLGYAGLRFDGHSGADGLWLSDFLVEGFLAGARYAQPEGTYAPTYAKDHAYDVGGVLKASEWTGSPLVATGRPPLSLAMLVLPDGQPPPTATAGYGDSYGNAYPASTGLVAVDGCFSPLRDTTYDAATGLGAVAPNLHYRLWFVVNDGLGDFTDDSGGYSVLVERISDRTMPVPLESLISPRFGLQTAVGVRSEVFRMLGCIADKGFKPKPDQQWEESGTAGFGYQTDSTLIYDVSSGDLTLNLDTLDTGYVLYSIFGGVTVTQLAPGVYKHDFEYSPFAQAMARAFSAQTPTEAGEIAQALMDIVFNGLKIGADPGKLPTASTSFMGGKISLTGDVDMPALTAGANCVQVVSTNGAPTGGNFVLLDHTRASSTINVTDAASAVQTAIRLLGGDYAAATVSGAAGNWNVTSPTGKTLAPLVPDFTNAAGESTLVGGVSPTVTVAVTNPGGFKINPAARCSAQSWCLKVAPSWNALENAPINMTDNWSSSVTIGERYARKWIQSCSPNVFTYVQKDGKDIADTLELEMALVDPVRTFINASRSGQRLCARLQSIGAAIGTTGYKRSFTIDMDGQAKWPDNTDSDNVRSVKIDFRILYNIVSGQMLRVSIVSEVPSYSVN